MTTKVSNPRIIIEVFPDGTSKMTADGRINQVAIALTLSAQLNVLLPNMFKAVFSAASGLVDPKTGMPVPGSVPYTMEVSETPNEPVQEKTVSE